MTIKSDIMSGGSFNISDYNDNVYRMFEFRFAQETLVLKNTAGTTGGPGSRDRTLAVKRRKNARKSAFFFVKK